MADALNRLNNVITDIETQAKEINEHKAVLKHIAQLKLEVKSTAEQANLLVGNQERLLGENESFIRDSKERLSAFDTRLNALNNSVKTQLSKSSNSLSEKIIQIREESLSGRKEIKDNIDSVIQAITTLEKKVDENLEVQVSKFKHLEDKVHSQGKDLKNKNYFIIVLLVVLIALQFTKV